MNPDFFQDKVALVTGSSRGMGNAIAWRLAQEGAHLVIHHRKPGGSSEEKAQRLLQQIHQVGRKALLFHADISDKAEVRRLMENVERDLGRLDLLVLNAAKAPFKPIHRLLERDLRELVGTNLFGNIFLIQESLPMLERAKGKIVFISSLGSRFYQPSYPLGWMKAAMEAVVRDCAEALRIKGISVNGICAGLVKTDSFKTLRLHWEEIQRIPEHLFLEPEEVADAVLFLCSPASRGVCGQTLIVDRGLSNSLYRSLP